MEFKVDAMSCNHCVSVVTQVVKSLDPDAKVEVDLAEHKVRVDSAHDPAAIARGLAEAGYPTSELRQ
jgi:copper chaperone